MSVEWFYSKKLPQFDTNVTVHTADRHLLSWLRKKVIQVVIFALQSELSCKNHKLLVTE